MAGFASAQPVDPKAPGAIALPELGRMHGSLKQVTAMDESFGRTLYSVGDVNNDGLGDWILAHRRCDTSFDGYAVVELLLYTGVRGGLPPASSGLRLGPSEIKSDCSFVGAGDYDADGFRDVVITTRVHDDPSTQGWWISSIVVYWGDGSGRFGNDDTTHLTGPTERLAAFDSPDHEAVAKAPEHLDFDSDGLEDLVLITKGQRYLAMAESPAPYLAIYRGRRGERWGRDGAGTRPDWQLWDLWQKFLFLHRVTVVDHDGDGALDLVIFVERGNPRLAQVAVFYGVRGGLPDTVAQHVVFRPYDTQPVATCELLDLTGDRIPELVTALVDTVENTTSGTRRWLVYVGRRGQRLFEQFGSGDDPPHPGDSLWWGRPWTIVLPPSAWPGPWYAPQRVILDPADIGLDGVGDFCAESWPTVICYNGGAFLDSKFDAWIDNVELAELDRGRLVQLGDIDGSRRYALGMAMAGGGVAFLAADRRVPRDGDSIRLPEGTDRPTSAVHEPDAAELALFVAPNPASLEVHVRWPPDGTSSGASVVLQDIAGRELRRWVLPPFVGELAIDLRGVPPGLYLVSLRGRGRVTTRPFLHSE